MSEKTEALRLADYMDNPLNDPNDVADAVSSELRRLHQFAEDQIGRATTAEAALQMTKATHALKIAAVEAQRDALLEAAQICLKAERERRTKLLPGAPATTYCEKRIAMIEAAIKAVEESK